MQFTSNCGLTAASLGPLGRLLAASQALESLELAPWDRAWDQPTAQPLLTEAQHAEGGDGGFAAGVRAAPRLARLVVRGYRVRATAPSFAKKREARSGAGGRAKKGRSRSRRVSAPLAPPSGGRIALTRAGRAQGWRSERGGGSGERKRGPRSVAGAATVAVQLSVRRVRNSGTAAVVQARLR